MHALIVVAHHHPRSLTHALAARIAEGVVRAGHSAETADLAAEASSRASAWPTTPCIAARRRLPPTSSPSRRASIAPIPWCWSTRSTGGRCRPCSRAGSIACSPMAGPSTTASAATCGKSCSACAWCWSVSAAPMPAPSSGTLRRGDAHPDRPWHLRLLRRTGGPFRTVAGVGERRSDPASGPGPAHRQPALRRTRRAGGRPGAAAGGLTPGHSARCMAKPARCGASSSRRVSAGIR